MKYTQPREIILHPIIKAAIQNQTPVGNSMLTKVAYGHARPGYDLAQVIQKVLYKEFTLRKIRGDEERS